ncbi:MAG TPA: hypothetical protein VF240_01785 [Pyrinomonadaceae bacterium]
MSDNATTELIIVLAVMLLLFIFGLAAVVIFWRVWRREQKSRVDGDSADEPRSGGRM